MHRKGQTVTQTTTIVLIVLFVTVLTVIFTPVLRDALLPWTKYNAEVDSAEKVIEQTYDPNNAIYNYEWFKNQEQKIKSTEQQIQNTINQRDDFLKVYGNASTWDWSTKEEYGRISTTLNGQKNFYSDLVAEYNARSSMVNREIFKDNLPRNIDKRIW